MVIEDLTIDYLCPKCGLTSKLIYTSCCLNGVWLCARDAQRQMLNRFQANSGLV